MEVFNALSLNSFKVDVMIISASGLPCVSGDDGNSDSPSRMYHSPSRCLRST